MHLSDFQEPIGGGIYFQPYIVQSVRLQLWYDNLCLITLHKDDGSQNFPAAVKYLSVYKNTIKEIL